MLKGCGRQERLGSQKCCPRLSLGQAPLCPGVCPRQGSSLASARISFLPWFQICQMGRQQRGGAGSTCRGREQGGEEKARGARQPGGQWRRPRGG